LTGIQNSTSKESTSLWPVWVALGFPLLLIVLNASPAAMDLLVVLICIPALCITWAVFGVWSAILSAKWLRQRAWRRAGICAALPLFILLVSLNNLAIIRFCANAGDTLHFYVRYPAYMKVVHDTPQDGNPRLLTINLGGMSWASRGFVYDEGDEVMRNSSFQSSAWKARAQNTELGCGYGALPIPGPATLTRHWYIASFAC